MENKSEEISREIKKALRSGEPQAFFDLVLSDKKGIDICLDLWMEHWPFCDRAWVEKVALKIASRKGLI